ncbi:GlcG/HbpS family heme-binding protein [Actinacidiphila soli]|uniref:GlcG/HbpS family heme-binding protein n=1 Tax=Actinacidiphila soli TaxID=2487275 RepID=UPI000FCAF28E|nr:heme-binding protein [Actinacidiphila soli]
MEVLLLKDASRMVDSALEHGRALECHPLTVAVLDPGGHLLALKREDDSGILRPDIAQAKAWGALGMGAGGRNLARRAATAPAFFEALSAISGGRIAPVPGGVLVRDSEGRVIGAVGVSGDHPDKDEACAVYGIESAGFTADGG